MKSAPTLLAVAREIVEGPSLITWGKMLRAPERRWMQVPTAQMLALRAAVVVHAEQERLRQRAWSTRVVLAGFAGLASGLWMGRLL